MELRENLLQGLSSPDPFVRSYVARSVLPEQYPDLRERLVELALHDEKWSVRLATLETLMRYDSLEATRDPSCPLEDRPAFQTAFQILFTDPDWHVRFRAGQLMAELDLEAFIDRFEKALLPDEMAGTEILNWPLRDYLISYLASLATLQVRVDLLLRIFDMDPVASVDGVIAAIQKAGMTPARRRLIELLRRKETLRRPEYAFLLAELNELLTTATQDRT